MHAPTTSSTSYTNILLIEGASTFRPEIITALNKRFPDANTRKLSPGKNPVQNLGDTHWEEYDLVLISSPDPAEKALSWLHTIRQRYAEPAQPLILVLTDTNQCGRNAVWAGADFYVQRDVTQTDFAAHLDNALEVKRLTRHYPMQLPHWHSLETLHNSENAVIFLMENLAGEKAVIKRFKFDISGLPETAIEQFIQDAGALMQQQAPHLIQILDAGVTHGAVYLILEYIQGNTLKTLLENSDSFDLGQRLSWFRAITRALNHIHKLGLLHRDLKSSNILIRKDGSPVLLDFGIENQLLLGSGFLQENEIYCTPFYVSPERIIGEPATIQSDLYALGVLFYELLMNDKPYSGGNLGEILQQHLFAPQPVLPEKFALYQPLLSCLLAKSPEGRMNSAAEVLAWLNKHTPSDLADAA